MGGSLCPPIITGRHGDLPLQKLMHNLIKGLKELIYPSICPICKNKITAEETFVCVNCWNKIIKNQPPFCYSCGRSLTKRKTIRNVCVECIKQPLYFDRGFSPCIYEGVIKELISLFKYKSRDYLGKLLSGPMIEFIKEYNLPMQLIDAIIPIPLFKTKEWEREFNQALILSNYIGLEFNKKILPDGLFRHKNTKTQTSLKDAERLSNVQDAFLVPEQAGIKGKNILLVDDILTTAATCSEAARALKNAGAHIVYALTLAN